MQIEVSLEVYKALTVRLTHDGQTYDDIIRDILVLDSQIEPEAQPPILARNLIESIEDMQKSLHRGAGVFFSRELILPSGTELRARHKGAEYRSTIINGDWVGANGQVFSSPSAAASAVTGTNVNGLRFWEAKRPDDDGWLRLDVIVASKKA